MNSELNTLAGCGEKFNEFAHYQVWSHENKNIAQRYSKSFGYQITTVYQIYHSLTPFQSVRAKKTPKIVSGVK